MPDSIRLVVSPEESGERLDRYLAKVLPERGGRCADLNRSQLKRHIDDGQVLLDGRQTRASARLKGGEIVQVVLPDPISPDNRMSPMFSTIPYLIRFIASSCLGLGYR